MEEDYDAACARCEHVVLVDAAARAQLILALRHDKRASWPRGLALTRDFPELGLVAGDRVEPSATLPDVSMLETVATPVIVTFWRRSAES